MATLIRRYKLPSGQSKEDRIIEADRIDRYLGMFPSRVSLFPLLFFGRFLVITSHSDFFKDPIPLELTLQRPDCLLNIIFVDLDAQS